MKILYINCSRIPTEKAHGLQMMKMCEAFASLSNNIELWVPRRLNRIKQNSFEYYNVEKNFKIRKIPCVDFLAINKGPVGFCLTEAAFLLFAICYLPFEKADIIYTRDKFVAFFLSFFKNNIYFEDHTAPARIFFSRVKKLKGVILVTNNLKKIFQERGVSSDKILVAPDGVDLEEFNIKESREECRKKLNLPLDKKIIMYAGSLLPWKGVETLLGAARNFSPYGRSPAGRQNVVLFVIVGGTEKDAQNVKCQMPNVKYVPRRPHSEMPYWLKAADVLVLPNSGKYDISKYWTSPLKLFEYMASKRPIVASDLPSIREVLSNENSILVEPDNPESLARGINKVLDDSMLSEIVAKQAFLDVEKYSWKTRADKILGFINARY